jgi:hypothetical protein
MRIDIGGDIVDIALVFYRGEDGYIHTLSFEEVEVDRPVIDCTAYVCNKDQDGYITNDRLMEILQASKDMQIIDGEGNLWYVGGKSDKSNRIF